MHRNLSIRLFIGAVAIVHLQRCVILCDPTDYSTPGFPVLHHLPELAQSYVYWVSDAIQPSQSSVIPFSSCPQSFPASGSFQMSQFFPSGGPKYWSFSFSISPSNKYSGLISFRIDRFDLLAVQGQGSFPTPQFESINYLVLSFSYGPTLTFLHAD